MPDYKKKYEKYKDKYRRLKKRLQNDRNNMFQPIRPQPILLNSPGQMPVVINSLRPSSPVLFNEPSPILFRPPSPLIFRPPSPVLYRVPSPILFRTPFFSSSGPTPIERKQYLVFAIPSDSFKINFSRAIDLLKKIYSPDYLLKENVVEPHITLAYGPRITSSEELQYNDSTKINQILGGFINKYNGTLPTVKFNNIGFFDNPEQIVIYAAIESSILSEMYTYLKDNVPDIKLINEENKITGQLHVTLLYLKPNILNKTNIIKDAMEDAKNMLAKNSINFGDNIPIKSIQLITPFRNNIFTLW